MTDRRFLHAIAVPEQILERPRGDQSERVASAGALNTDVPAVESVAPDAATQTVAGVVGGQYAELTAAELEELFGASGITVVPFFGDSDDTQRDGYYATEDVSLNRPAADTAQIQRFDGQLTWQGSRRSHRRAVRTTPTTESNPFGSATTEEVGIPARASDVQWLDDRGGTFSTESATIQRTETGQHDDIDIYDATEPSFDDPALVYDVPYRDEWPVDCRVWDDYNRQRRVDTSDTGDTVGSGTVGSATVGSVDEVVAWQRVYRSDHEAIGTLLIENDLLQVRLDESRGQLIVRRWDDADGQYTRVQLDTASDWRFVRADLRSVGVEAVDAQLTFADGTSEHNLNASVKRGYTDILFLNPDNAGSVPSGLTTRLDPVAADTDQDPGGVADIIPKSEVGD